jgi:hypothetical protein
VAYHRQQEQANQGLNTAVQSIQGGLSGRGVDPNSAMGKSLEQGAVMESQRLRSEAARDQSLMEETLRRQDIQSGIANYMQFLQSIFQLGASRAAAATGGGFPQVMPINPYANLGAGLTSTAYGLANYFGNQSQQQQQPGVPGPGFLGTGPATSGSTA